MAKRYGIGALEWDSLVSAVYDCALDPGRWNGVLQSIGQLTQSHAGVLHCLNHQSRAGQPGSVLIEHNTDPSWSLKYREHYAALNPERHRVKQIPLFKPFTFSDLFGWDAFAKTAYHNEYRAPQGFGDSLNLLIERDNRRTVSISLFRPAHNPIFGAGDKLLIERLVPHIKRCSQIAGLLEHTNGETDRLTEVLNRLNLGVVILDQDRRMMYCNPVADVMATEQVFALRRDGTLLFAEAADTAWLAQCFKGIAGPGAKRALAVADAARSVVATAILVDRSEAGIRIFQDVRRSFCLLVLNRATADAPGGRDILAQTHALSPAELRVLGGLLDGSRLTAIAADLDIKLSTVKTHLQQIFAKTGTHRQADLVRKAAALRLAIW